MLRLAGARGELPPQYFPQFLKRRRQPSFFSLKGGRDSAAWPWRGGPDRGSRERSEQRLGGSAEAGPAIPWGNVSVRRGGGGGRGGGLAEGSLWERGLLTWQGMAVLGRAGSRYASAWRVAATSFSPTLRTG